MTDELSGAIRIRGVYNAEGDPGLVGISLFGRVLAGAGRVFGGRLFAGEVPDYTEGAVLQREADDNYGAFSQFSVRMSFSDLDDEQYRNLFGTPLDSVRPLFSFLRLQTRRYPDPKWIDRFRGMVRRAQLTRGVLSIDTTDAIYRLRQSRLVFEWQDEGMLLRKNNDGEYEIESEDETSFTNGLNRVDPLFRECRIDDGAFTERRVDIYPFQVEENIFRISRARRAGTKTYLQFSQDADFHLPATIFSRKPIEFPTGNPVEILRTILSEKNVDGKFRYVTEGEDNWDPEMYDSSRRACDYTPVRVRLFSGGEESVYQLCNALAQICNASFGWNGFGLFVFDALRPHPRPGVPGKVLIGDEAAWGFSYEDTVDNLHTSFQVDYDWADDDKQYGPRNMRRIKYDFEELLPDLPPENILERRGRLLLADRRIDLDFPYVRLNSVARVAVMRRSREELARRRRLDLSMHALDQDSYELEIGDYVDVHPEEYPPYAGDISQFHVPTVPMRIRGRSVDLDTGRVDISAAPYAIIRHGLFDSGRAPGVIRVCGVWNDLVGSHVDAIAYFGNTVGEEISYWRRDPVTGKTYLGQIRLDGTRIARGLGESSVASAPEELLPPPPVPRVDSISLYPAAAIIEVGATIQLTATAWFHGEDGLVPVEGVTFVWWSSDDSIATVSNAGLVTGMNGSETGLVSTITVQARGKQDTAEITVVRDVGPPPPPPDCEVPAVTINGPGEVVRGERAVFTAVPQGGTYDRAQNAWSADRGSFGPGLWQAEYQAPDTIGEDVLSVQVRIHGLGRLAVFGCTDVVTVTKRIDVVDPPPPPPADFVVSVIPRLQADCFGCQNSGVAMEYTTDQDRTGARAAFSYEEEGSGRVSTKVVDLEANAGGGSRAELLVTDLDPNTRYVFGCQLYVDGAASGTRLERTLTTSSNVPCIVTGEVLVQGQTAMLTWSDNGDGGSPITRFEVWYESRTGSVSHASPRIRVGGNGRSATLGPLNWDTLYWAYIQAFNDVGGSCILRLSVRVGEEIDICRFLQNPRTFSAFRRCSAIELSFKAPADSFTGLPTGVSAEQIKGYRIEYIRQDANLSRISWESVLVTTLPGQLDISETISGLDIDTAYRFKFFTLTQNCSSSGVERAYSTISAERPDKVNGVSALPAGGTIDALDIAWDPNSGCSQNGFRYELRYRPTQGTAVWTEREGAIDDTALRQTGLLQDTYYDIQVRADNKQQTNNFGPWSDTVSAKTNREAAPPIEAPGRPLRPSVRGYSTNTALDPVRIFKLEVSWFRPANGGSPITGYQVRYRRGTIAWSTFSDPNYGTDIPADTLAVTLHSLNSFSLYQVQVRAKNHPDTVDVWGPWSASGEGTTGTIDSTEPPLAPGSHTVTNITHNSISTTWSRSPSREGVPDPDGYIVRYRVSGQEATEQTDTVGPEIFIYTFSGLLAFTTYDIWVAGYSNLHPRNNLNWTQVSPKPRTLNAPIFPRPVISSAPTLTTPSRGAILVDFPLIQSQGAAITGRFVEYRKDAAGEDWIRADIGASSRHYTITSLEDDTAYRVRVLASNNAGTSEPSPEATATTQSAPAVTPPIDDPPENVSAAFEPTTATISWQAPSAAGVFPAGYEVRYKKKTDTAWTPINGISDSSRSQEIAGLSLDTEYQLAVRSRYTQGDARSPWVEVSGRTTLPRVPSAVPTPTVQNVTWLYGEPSARVCSEFPSDFGGIPVTGLSYRLYRFNDRGNPVLETSGTLWTSTRTYILLNGLIPDTQYQVEVAWRNAIGRAIFSGRATFITPKTSDLATHSRIGGCS